MNTPGFILWIVLVDSMVNQVCGTGCRFYGNIAKCNHANLRYIPKIPGCIKILEFIGNELGDVTTETFRNIETPGNMRRILLMSDGIANISEHAFDMFTNLWSIALSENRINLDDMKHLLVQLSRENRLDALYLESMGSETIRDETFSLLNLSPASYLDLKYNSIEKFSVDTLKRLKNLTELVLDHNILYEFKLPEMKSLKTLRVSNNKLSAVPNFCFENSAMISLSPNLERLYLNHNHIMTITKETFRCLPNLRHLELTYNFIANVPRMLLSNNPKIESLDLKGNIGQNKKIHPFAFSSNTLQKLRISFDGTAGEIFESIPDTFEGLPQLLTLQIDYINMDNLTNTDVSDLFSPLPNLRSIMCYDCKLKCDLRSILKNKPYLARVDLEGNDIQNIAPGTFSASSSIRELLLRRNKIGTFSSDALPIGFLNNLRELRLSLNPFICDCNLQWFINWLKATDTSRLKYYPKEYMCASPAKWANKQLNEVRFTYLDCHPFSTIEWVGMIGGPLVIIFTTAALVLYRNRWNIKHYIYLMRRRRQYTPLEGYVYDYDAFVAYSSTESLWIKTFLVPMLEDESNIKLCVHDRDFQAGTFINDNIVERMKESKRIILVLSNSFANSDWCMFELKVAHSMHIEDNVDVIAIMFEELLGRNMNNSLKVLLESTTYIEWTNDAAGRELFVTKLKDSLGVAVNG